MHNGKIFTKYRAEAKIMMKNKRAIRIIIVMTSIVIAVSLYLLAYTINESNMVDKFSKYLKSDTLEIIDIYQIEENAGKNQFVYFETNNSWGVALLHKGLNGNYQMSDLHQTNKEIDAVSFLIEGFDYTIIYGKSDKKIAHVNFSPEENGHIENVSSKYIFMVQRVIEYDGFVKIVYDESAHRIPRKVLLQSSQGSSWKSILLPFRSVCIIILSVVFTSVFIKRNDLNAYNKLEKDGQRIKQFWMG